MERDRGAGEEVWRVHRQDGLHGARLRRAHGHEQIDCAYRGNIVERFVWVVE